MVHRCYMARLHNFDATGVVPFATKTNDSDIVTKIPTNNRRNCVETLRSLAAMW